MGTTGADLIFVDTNVLIAANVIAHPQHAVALQSKMQIADDTIAVTENLLALLRTVALGGKQIHHANIVATMQAFSIPRLLTDNVSDFRRFGSLILIHPSPIEVPWTHSAHGGVGVTARSPHDCRCSCSSGTSPNWMKPGRPAAA